jgi:hypothetical protein
MTTLFSTSTTRGEEKDSFIAGKEVAQAAMKKLSFHTKVDLVILFCSVKYDYLSVMKGIASIVGDQTPIVGCTSAGQFSDENVAKDGISCALISSNTHRFFSGIGTNLKHNPIKTVEKAVKDFPQEVEGYPYQAAMLFVDGLAGMGEETVLAASSVLGPMVKFAGGAAADNLNFKETKVFGQGQALTNALSMCLIASKRPIIIALKHGHQPISPPLRITKAKNNVLYEVEGQPALEVWKKYIRERLKEREIDIDSLDQKALSRVLLKYEAGLMTGTEYKIRFPASCNPNGSLNFVCSILEGSVIKIMDSEEKDQIESAREAAELALKASRGVKLAGAVVFDCACRAMILQDQFNKAIEANKEVLGSLPFVGCETYGEIAMEMGQLSGFHNTTTVIMLFPA